MERQSRVNSGMIPMALAIAVVGFLLGNHLTGFAAVVNIVVYIISGLAAVVLCVRYTIAWIIEQHKPLQRSPRSIVAVGAAYGSLTFLLWFLFLVLGFKLLGYALFGITFAGIMIIIVTCIAFTSLDRAAIMVMLLGWVMFGVNLTLVAFYVFRPSGS